MKKYLENLVDITIGHNSWSYYASIIEYSSEKYEVAVLEVNNSTGERKLDYSYNEDVIILKSSMEVYGYLNYELRPHYLEEKEKYEKSILSDDIIDDMEDFNY